jgi:hypothetical protein
MLRKRLLSICYNNSIGIFGKRTYGVRYFFYMEVWAVNDLLFPTLRGLAYPIIKTPHWKTLQTQTISGVKKFIQLYTYPYYSFTLTFNYLGDTNSQTDDIHTLAGFYNSVGGAGVDFLYADPLFEDNTVALQPIADTDGETKEFQLVHTYGGFTEPVFGIFEHPKIFKKNKNTDDITELVEGTDYEINSLGLVTFNSAPSDGYTLLWTGKWYYRCHFAEDETELEQIFYGGWSLDELTLESIKVD